MADLPVFGPSDLHRMVPSDLAEMAKHLSTPAVAKGISRAFADYLALLEKPGAVELDDVVRITVQLDSIGFWEKISPKTFIRDNSSRFDKDVLAQLCATLGVEFLENAYDRRMPHAAEKKQAETILNDIMTKITKHRKKRERIRIEGLGVVQVSKRTLRAWGATPSPAKQSKSRRSKKVAFRAAKAKKKA